jgi:hypothetical protein
VVGSEHRLPVRAVQLIAVGQRQQLCEAYVQTFDMAVLRVSFTVDEGMGDRRFHALRAEPQHWHNRRQGRREEAWKVGCSMFNQPR